MPKPLGLVDRVDLPGRVFNLSKLHPRLRNERRCNERRCNERRCNERRCNDHKLVVTFVPTTPLPASGVAATPLLHDDNPVQIGRVSLFVT